MVRWLRFPVFASDLHFNFEKVSKRTHLDIASVNTAMRLVIEDGRIARAGVAAGGVAPIPLKLARTAAFLVGCDLSAETASEAAAIARSEAAPISDVRGSAEYKEILLGQLILAHFNNLCDHQLGAPKALAQ